MFCSNCGRKLRQGVKFCPECGKKVVVNSFCTNCGKPLSEGDKVCSSCGAEVEVDYVSNQILFTLIKKWKIVRGEQGKNILKNILALALNLIPIATFFILLVAEIHYGMYFRGNELWIKNLLLKHFIVDYVISIVFFGSYIWFSRVGKILPVLSQKIKFVRIFGKINDKFIRFVYLLFGLRFLMKGCGPIIYFGLYDGLLSTVGDIVVGITFVLYWGLYKKFSNK